MSLTTKSCVISGAYQVDIVAEPIDYQGKGTLVRITRGGICGSDLHYFQHGKIGAIQLKMPMTLGHEVVGHVVESDDPTLTAQQKVAINPSLACGECKYCQADEENQCLNMRFFGSAMANPHVHGGFTEYKIVDSKLCVPFSATADDRVMVFAEPLAVCIHAVNQAGDVKGKKVFVSGTGPIGCLIIAAAKASGAAEIVATDVSPRSQQLAQAMGATQVLDAASGDFGPWQVEKGGFDVSFEASGHPASLSRCFEVTRARGTVVQVGMNATVADFPLMTMIAKEIHFVGSFRFTHEFASAVAWLESGKVDPMPLYSGEFPAAEITQALTLAGDKTQAAKVQLSFE